MPRSEATIATAGEALETEEKAMEAMVDVFRCIVELEKEHDRVVILENRPVIDVIMNDLTTKFSIVCNFLAKAIPIKEGDRYRAAERALYKARETLPESAKISRLRVPTTPKMALRRLQSCSSLPSPTLKRKPTLPGLPLKSGMEKSVSFQETSIYPLLSPRVKSLYILEDLT